MNKFEMPPVRTFNMSTKDGYHYTMDQIEKKIGKPPSFNDQPSKWEVIMKVSLAVVTVAAIIVVLRND